MVLVRASQVLMLIAALLVSPAFASRVRRAATAPHHRRAAHAVAHRRSVHRRYARHERHDARARHYAHARFERRASVQHVRGQRSIDSARATQIQEALIKAKYLSGAPTGTWDADTVAAMKKYQADHGWQTRLMPDSRALIALGLGPTQDHIPQSGTTIDAAQEIDSQPNTLASVHAISQ